MIIKIKDLKVLEKYKLLVTFDNEKKQSMMLKMILTLFHLTKI